MGLKKRQMMYIPEVNPDTFVFFFERGTSGGSWSIRDYSIENYVRLRGAKHYRWTADEVHQHAKYSFDVETVSTDNLAHWHSESLRLNERYLKVGGSSAPIPVAPEPAERAPRCRPRILWPGPEVRESGNHVRVLNMQELLQSPKGRKTGDMDRILHSPNSEDWVTWNFFQILQQLHPTDWWAHVAGIAKSRNPALTFPSDVHTMPALKLWTPVPAPREYEVLSRTRMMESGDPESMQRAQILSPVEGFSEIDIALDHGDFLVFAEAKLGSDINPDTKHDPRRNQIVRNIDCLLEMAGTRTPIFWMLVRDEEPARAYVQLMNSHKTDHGLLCAALPHRDPEVLRQITNNLTILRWSDFRDLLFKATDDPLTVSVQQELRRRIIGPWSDLS